MARPRSVTLISPSSTLIAPATHPVHQTHPTHSTTTSTITSTPATITTTSPSAPHTTHYTPHTHTMSSLPLHLEALHKAKTDSRLTFAQIATKINKPEVWTAAVFYGQARPDEETAAAIVHAVLPGSNVMLQTRGSAERIAVSPDIIVQELAGMGQSNLGVGGMVLRNQGVESVPKVSLIRARVVGVVWRGSGGLPGRLAWTQSRRGDWTLESGKRLDGKPIDV